MVSLVTGAYGFIGLHLIPRLEDLALLIGSRTSSMVLDQGLQKADRIYHLAGANRPSSELDFERVNVGFTRTICEKLLEFGRKPTIVFASSIQAELDNPYGNSKRRAEEVLQEFGVKSGADIRIYRLRNVFGRRCRPNYNSVVATFCYNLSHGLPIEISDPEREIELVYVEDVVDAFVKLSPPVNIPFSRITLGELATILYDFKVGSEHLGGRCIGQLCDTYFSYVGGDA